MFRAAMVALLLGLAGCSGLGGPATPNQPPSTTAPTTTTLETTGTEITPTTVAESDIVDYAELSSAQQRAFDHAIQGETRFVPASVAQSSYLDESYFAEPVAAPFTTTDYVRKDGVLYRLDYDRQAGRQLTSYSIRATESQPDKNDTVRRFEALSVRGQRLVRSAIENGSYDLPWGESIDTRFSLQGDYVRYNGTVYRTDVTIEYQSSDTLRADRAG
jgi:hypothetical protein